MIPSAKVQQFLEFPTNLLKTFFGILGNNVIEKLYLCNRVSVLPKRETFAKKIFQKFSKTGNIEGTDTMENNKKTK